MCGLLEAFEGRRRHGGLLGNEQDDKINDGTFKFWLPKLTDGKEDGIFAGGEKDVGLSDDFSQPFFRLLVSLENLEV